MAVSMAASRTLFVVVLGCGEVALVPTWLGGSSWRGRFGDIGHRRLHQYCFVQRGEGRGSGGGRRRALHDPISLPIVVRLPITDGALRTPLVSDRARARG